MLSRDSESTASPIPASSTSSSLLLPEKENTKKMTGTKVPINTTTTMPKEAATNGTTKVRASHTTATTTASAIGSSSVILSSVKARLTADPSVRLARLSRQSGNYHSTNTSPSISGSIPARYRFGGGGGFSSGNTSNIGKPKKSTGQRIYRKILKTTIRVTDTLTSRLNRQNGSQRHPDADREAATPIAGLRPPIQIDEINIPTSVSLRSVVQPNNQQPQAPRPIVAVPLSKSLNFTDNLSASTDNTSTTSIIHESSPQAHLDLTLASRGYSTARYNSLESGYYNCNGPSPLQLSSYGVRLLELIDSDDEEGLESFLLAGIHPNPCNEYNQSILHKICQAGNIGLLDVLLENTDSHRIVQIADDFGRTPLHEACSYGSSPLSLSSSSSPLVPMNGTNGTGQKHPQHQLLKPCLVVVETLMMQDIHLLYMADASGNLPLELVPVQFWNDYIQFIDAVADRFWPSRFHDNKQQQQQTKQQNQSPTSESNTSMISTKSNDDDNDEDNDDCSKNNFDEGEDRFKTLSRTTSSTCPSTGTNDSIEVMPTTQRQEQQLSAQIHGGDSATSSPWSLLPPSPQPPLTLVKPGSSIVPDPSQSLTVELAWMVCSGVIEPEEATSYMDERVFKKFLPTIQQRLNQMALEEEAKERIHLQCKQHDYVEYDMHTFVNKNGSNPRTVMTFYKDDLTV